MLALFVVGPSGPTSAAAPAGPAGAMPAERPQVRDVGPGKRELDLPAVAPGGVASESRDRATAEAVRELEGDAVFVDLVDPDGAPVAGARVLVAADVADDDLDGFGDLNEIDAWMEERGSERESDVDGRLPVPVPGVEHSTLVTASHGELWGRVRVQQRLDEAVVELEMARDRTLRARVVHSGGHSVPGVTVGIRQKTEWGSWSLRDTTTDEREGLAVFRHVQESIHRWEDRSFAVGVDALFEPSVEHVFEPGNIPAEVVVLVLPPFGAVEVRVADENGRPFEREAVAELGIVEEGQPRELSPFGNQRRETVDRAVANGVARFPHVGLGHELAIAVTRDRSGVSTRKYGIGPRAAGEAVRFDVRLGSDHPVVLLRAVDERGAALADTLLRVRTTVKSGNFANDDEVETTSADDGSFRVDLGNDWKEGYRRDLIVRLGGEDAADVSARVDLSRRLPPGLNDLGQVALAPPQLLVQGRVVSTEGVPIGGAVLKLEHRSGDTRWWRKLDDLELRSNENGTFEVRDDRVADQLRLVARKPGWAGLPREFARGARDLVIELTAAGGIEGRVLLDDPISPELLSARISATVGVEYLEWSEQRGDLGDDGSFRFARLVPGQHTVAIQIDRNYQQSLASIPGVQVVSGETNRDPRLVIDLRGRLWSHAVRVVVDEGERVQGDLRYGPVGATELENNHWFHEREFDLVTEFPLIDLVANARGYRATKLQSVGGEIEIRPERGLEVRVKLAGGAALPEPPIFIKATLAPVESDHGTIDWGAAAFDEKREIVVLVPGPGQMKVTWVVERRSSGSSMATTVEVEPEQLVEIRDEAGQTIEVALTDEQLRQITGAFDD